MHPSVIFKKIKINKFILSPLDNAEQNIQNSLYDSLGNEL